MTKKISIIAKILGMDVERLECRLPVEGYNCALNKVYGLLAQGIDKKNLLEGIKEYLEKERETAFEEIKVGGTD
jgi:hypothetical protein